MSKQSDTLATLHSSLDGRERPEDIADTILTGFDDLTGRERVVLERAAQHSWHHRWPGYSSMSRDFTRPAGAARQLGALETLFGPQEADAYDPADLRRVAALAGEQIHWQPGHIDFKADRLDAAARRAAGLKISRRQYNKRFRLLLRFAHKIDTLETELRKRELMLIGRSGLAADITAERFADDPVAARFIAYWVARRNLRRQFSLSGRENPYDEIADVLFQRCLARDDTDWWMISRAYTVPSVVRRLTAQERGELLGRWSALMRGAAEILERCWDPGVDRKTMIVRRGMDSSTWNTIAQAYNTARAGWMNALAASGALDLLDVACPGKVMRLTAADLAYWHRSTGSDVDPDTGVWAMLPLPWDVLAGRVACVRQTVTDACRAYAVDPEKRGWITPRATGATVAFTPTPELVHGVSICDPVWAGMLRRAGVFSGKKIKDEYVDDLPSGIPSGVVISDLPVKSETHDGLA